MWVLSKYPSILQSVGGSKLPVGVDGCLSLYVRPEMNRQTVQADPAFTQKMLYLSIFWAMTPN